MHFVCSANTIFYLTLFSQVDMHVSRSFFSLPTSYHFLDVINPWSTYYTHHREVTFLCLVFNTNIKCTHLLPVVSSSFFIGMNFTPFLLASKICIRLGCCSSVLLLWLVVNQVVIARLIFMWVLSLLSESLLLQQCTVITIILHLIFILF